MTKLVLSDVRQVVADLRTLPTLDIRNSIQQLTASAKAQVDLHVDPALTLTNSRVAETLFRLVQEIVTNSNRHSHTGKLQISLRETEQHWQLDSHDGGTEPARLIPGSGIRGMRERVEKFGGRFELRTDDGLRYHASLPKHD